MTTTPNDLIKTFLNELAAVAVIPSTQYSIKIRPINIKQIKNIVDSSINTPYFDIGFRGGIIDALIQNIEIDIKDKKIADILTEVDMLLLYGYLKYEGSYKDTPIKDFLQKSFDAVKTPIVKYFTYNNLIVTFQFPSLTKIKMYDKFLADSIKVDEDGEIKNEQEASTNYFLIEMARYIDNIKSALDETVVYDSSLPIDKQFKIIEQLPYQIASESVGFSKQVLDAVSDCITHNTITLPFDVSFLE